MIAGPFCRRSLFSTEPPPPESYTLSLHDALPISLADRREHIDAPLGDEPADPPELSLRERSEEHTSELQSRLHLVCRLLLEKKKASRPALPALFALVGITAGAPLTADAVAFRLPP